MRAINFGREIRVNLSAFSFRDRIIVQRQMDKHVFDDRLVRGVSCRCRFGYPQVVVCHPFCMNRPFPTLFWLTCPYLTYICGMIESQGGVKDLENYLAERDVFYNVYNLTYARMRQTLLSECEKKVLKLYHPKIWLVIAQSGIGGIRRGKRPTAKCLHLQTAAFLSLHGHPGLEWFNSHIIRYECDNALCTQEQRHSG